MVYRKLIVLLYLLLIPVNIFCGGQGSRFIFAQLKFSGNWDPHPTAFTQIYHYLSNTTSLRVNPERRVITAGDEELFFSPFLLFTGMGSYPAFKEEEIINLRRYIQGGGIIFIDTAICSSNTNS